MRSVTHKLSDWRNQQVFVGRDAGAVCRAFFQLDSLDRDDDVEITIEVPRETYSVNSSFFLGMFGDSIRTLGEEGFRSKYLFSGKDISRTVNDGIRHALDRASPLGAA